MYLLAFLSISNEGKEERVKGKVVDCETLNYQRKKIIGK